MCIRDSHVFIIEESCTIIKPFLIIFPILLLNKKSKTVLKIFVLLIFLNFFRQITEIFLYVNFENTLMLSDLQNVVLPYLIIFLQLLKDYSTTKVLSN